MAEGNKKYSHLWDREAPWDGLPCGGEKGEFAKYLEKQIGKGEELSDEEQKCYDDLVQYLGKGNAEARDISVDQSQVDLKMLASPTWLAWLISVADMVKGALGRVLFSKAVVNTSLYADQQYTNGVTMGEIMGEAQKQIDKAKQAGENPENKTETKEEVREENKEVEEQNKPQEKPQESPKKTSFFGKVKGLLVSQDKDQKTTVTAFVEPDDGKKNKESSSQKDKLGAVVELDEKTNDIHAVYVGEVDEQKSSGD